MIKRGADVGVALYLMAAIIFFIVPIPSFLLDILLIFNISVALVILFNCLFVQEVLDMSFFPTLLLFTTIFRISLNVSSTRLILNSGDPGNVVRTFGQFVGGNDMVIGTIIFIILLIVQFVVINKGSERVSEVTARFTLDAMPGKQMAIDADLNTGAITDEEAKERREKIQEEAAFFEEVQRELIAILQDRTKPIGVRVDEYLDRANEYQKKLSQNDVEKHIDWLSFNDFSFEHFDIRFGIINEMELLRQVWQDFKDDMQTVLTEDDYEKRMKEYMASGDYRENDIEQLLVYFTFRYIMNAIYDSNIMVYAYLSVMFTMIVRDMNATRFYKNGGSFTIEDQMEVARIFSKEVEHSEENVEAAKEEIIWG